MAVKILIGRYYRCPGGAVVRTLDIGLKRSTDSSPGHSAITWQVTAATFV